jgi:hypothetical protein
MIDEIGWMVLPEHQGRGLASAGVAEALRRADEAARWRVLHAFPATTNAPSNALCRKHGFAMRGPIDYTYRGQSLRVNHWVRDTLAGVSSRREASGPRFEPNERGLHSRQLRLSILEARGDALQDCAKHPLVLARKTLYRRRRL